MTNPSNIVRLHSRNGGRASVYEANQWAQIYQAGILSGAGVEPATDLNVTVGGSQNNPTVLIAENSAGYKIALDLVGTTTLTLTTPASNSKIVSIVAYTDDLSVESTDTTVTGNPSSCGLLAVSGTSAATPTAPSDADIRAAITADGAAGSQAVYVVIANITLASTTEVISNTLIENFSAIIVESEVNPTKLGWRKMVVTGNNLILPANVKHVRIRAVVHSTAGPANTSSPSYLVVGNYSGNTYTRRISAAVDFLCEELTQENNGRIPTLRGAPTGDLAQDSAYWIDLIFPDIATTSNTVFGKLTLHSIHTFFSAFETFEYYLRSRTAEHTFQFLKNNATIDRCEWLVEYITREDAEEIAEEV